jgi:hypothetical protein
MFPPIHPPFTPQMIFAVYERRLPIKTELTKKALPFFAFKLEKWTNA